MRSDESVDERINLSMHVATDSVPDNNERFWNARKNQKADKTGYFLVEVQAMFLVSIEFVKVIKKSISLKLIQLL